MSQYDEIDEISSKFYSSSEIQNHSKTSLIRDQTDQFKTQNLTENHLNKMTN